MDNNSPKLLERMEQLERRLQEPSPYTTRRREFRKLYMRSYMRRRRGTRPDIGTMVNGKRVSMLAPGKRESPGYCELCSRNSRKLGYHHWDDSEPGKGIWLCYPCHIAVGVMDKNRGVEGKYRTLKKRAEKEFVANLVVEANKLR